MRREARILDGRYRPGAPLSELMLAETFGMSRTPVREMLSRLHQEGWVERVPSRGYFVARVTLRAIQDSFEVRRLLEGAAAAGAASHATRRRSTQLQQLIELEATVDAGNLADSASANRAFHQAVAAASHNQLAAELIAHCMATMDRVLALGVNALPLQRGTIAEHRAIVARIAGATRPAHGRPWKTISIAARSWCATQCFGVRSTTSARRSFLARTSFARLQEAV